jgi:transposase-like protein
MALFAPPAPKPAEPAAPASNDAVDASQSKRLDPQTALLRRQNRAWRLHDDKGLTIAHIAQRMGEPKHVVAEWVEIARDRAELAQLEQELRRVPNQPFRDEFLRQAAGDPTTTYASVAQRAGVDPQTGRQRLADGTEVARLLGLRDMPAQRRKGANAGQRDLPAYRLETVTRESAEALARGLGVMDRLPQFGL